MSLRVVEVETLDDLKAYVKEVTAKARGTVVTSEKPMSDLSKSLLSVWEKADFDGYTEALSEVLSIIVKAVAKETVIFPVKGRAKKYEAIVPTDNDNDHCYPLGQATVMRDDEYGLLEDGSEGDSMGDQWRYATDAEIDELFAKLPVSETEEIIEFFE